MRVKNALNADLVFVVSKQGKPLMPCSAGKARKLLNSQKAKVIRKTPFTLKLLYGSTGYIQEVKAAMDTGSKKIGTAASFQKKVLYQSEVELRGDVSSRMEQRAMYRRSRRSRKTRYRPARFDNRGKAGKLAPSLQSKLDSHLREKKAVERILPISQWVVELASFDIHKISDPQVSKQQGWTYQQGKQKDFYNVKAYILHRDQYCCQHCQKTGGISLQVHHIQFKSEGGTDTPENLITLCENCHTRLHAGHLGQTISEKLKKKTQSKTKHATQIGILKSQILKSEWKFQEAFGFETKFRREQELQLPKTHYYDAVALSTQGYSELLFPNPVYFKKHVSVGDYQQASGAHSEKKIPTGKLFGLRKFDQIQTPKGIGFIKGKRSTGYFAITRLDGTKIHDSVNVKKECIRLQARTTTLIEKGARLLPGLKATVSAALKN